MPIVKMAEQDRPTYGTLSFLRKVKPHHISREPQLIDPYVYETLSEFLGPDALNEFDGYSRSFYSLKGHYEHLWKYDIPIVSPPTDPLLTLATEADRSNP